ncbi:chaperone protein DnaJ [Nitzschia inconspicua]|uniref:Chaperone protein DnaJ n=1 Tax=Nitzschia inconspicua TaxID=303405 RepID=A0A9K3PJE6_9STRA|nr:chaperone protein DnaJ [Nitzschia inconspicua]
MPVSNTGKTNSNDSRYYHGTAFKRVEPMKRAAAARTFPHDASGRSRRNFTSSTKNYHVDVAGDMDNRTVSTKINAEIFSKRGETGKWSKFISNQWNSKIKRGNQAGKGTAQASVTSTSQHTGTVPPQQTEVSLGTTAAASMTAFFHSPSSRSTFTQNDLMPPEMALVMEEDKLYRQPTVEIEPTPYDHVFEQSSPIEQPLQPQPPCDGPRFAPNPYKNKKRKKVTTDADNTHQEPTRIVHGSGKSYMDPIELTDSPQAKKKAKSSATTKVAPPAAPLIVDLSGDDATVTTKPTVRLKTQPNKPTYEMSTSSTVSSYSDWFKDFTAKQPICTTNNALLIAATKSRDETSLKLSENMKTASSKTKALDQADHVSLPSSKARNTTKAIVAMDHKEKNNSSSTEKVVSTSSEKQSTNAKLPVPRTTMKITSTKQDSRKRSTTDFIIGGNASTKRGITVKVDETPSAITKTSEHRLPSLQTLVPPNSATVITSDNAVTAAAATAIFFATEKPFENHGSDSGGIEAFLDAVPDASVGDGLSIDNPPFEAVVAHAFKKSLASKSVPSFKPAKIRKLKPTLGNAPPALVPASMPTKPNSKAISDAPSPAQAAATKKAFESTQKKGHPEAHLTRNRKFDGSFRDTKLIGPSSDTFCQRLDGRREVSRTQHYRTNTTPRQPFGHNRKKPPPPHARCQRPPSPRPPGQPPPNFDLQRDSQNGKRGKFQPSNGQGPRGYPHWGQNKWVPMNGNSSRWEQGHPPRGYEYSCPSGPREQNSFSGHTKNNRPLNQNYVHHNQYHIPVTFGLYSDEQCRQPFLENRRRHVEYHSERNGGQTKPTGRNTQYNQNRGNRYSVSGPSRRGHRESRKIERYSYIPAKYATSSSLSTDLSEGRVNGTPLSTTVPEQPSLEAFNEDPIKASKDTVKNSMDRENKKKIQRNSQDFFFKEETKKSSDSWGKFTAEREKGNLQLESETVIKARNAAASRAICKAMDSFGEIESMSISRLEIPPCTTEPVRKVSRDESSEVSTVRKNTRERRGPVTESTPTADHRFNQHIPHASESIHDHDHTGQLLSHQENDGRPLASLKNGYVPSIDLEPGPNPSPAECMVTDSFEAGIEGSIVSSISRNVRCIRRIATTPDEKEKYQRPDRRSKEAEDGIPKLNSTKPANNNDRIMLADLLHVRQSLPPADRELHTKSNQSTAIAQSQKDDNTRPKHNCNISTNNEKTPKTTASDVLCTSIPVNEAGGMSMYEGDQTIKDDSNCGDSKSMKRATSKKIDDFPPVKMQNVENGTQSGRSRPTMPAPFFHLFGAETVDSNYPGVSSEGLKSRESNKLNPPKATQKPSSTAAKKPIFRPKKSESASNKKNISKNPLPCGAEAPPSAERRFVFATPTQSNVPPPKFPNRSNPMNEASTKSHIPHQKNPQYKEVFMGMSEEDALREQERLLNAAAARMRTTHARQARVHVTLGDLTSSTSALNRRFAARIEDIHKRYPDHWKYNDLYSRLGLPQTANDMMIKSQYRRLALVYHPDRNLFSGDTKQKFQAVTEAYHVLMGR